MLDAFESLPLESTTLIVACLSLAVVAMLVRWLPLRWMWFLAVAIPLGVAWIIYWLPFWLGDRTNAADYSAWVIVAIAFWGGAGIFACLALVGLFAWFKKKRGDG